MSLVPTSAKRVDRSKEIRKERFRSIAALAALVCIVAGVQLLFTGHDSGSILLSMIGIAVLLSGGVLLFTSSFFLARRKKSLENTHRWSSRLGSVLVAGTFGCALVTAGLLFYGFVYSDLTIVEWGVLVMWLGAAFFFTTLFIPRPKVIREVYPDAVRLSLSNLTDARSLGLEWPDSQPGLWVGIYDWNHVSSLDTRFLFANMQEDHRIFMAVSALKRDEEHEELKKLLRADGDQYLDELGRYGREEWHTIFASTRSESVLRHIFQRYQFYYGTYLSYPFIIAKGDLNLWIDWLRRLLKNGLKGATHDIIENTHCVIMTDWDHGLEMFTNKVSEADILKVAEEIARERSLPLINLADTIELRC